MRLNSFKSVRPSLRYYIVKLVRTYCLLSSWVYATHIILIDCKLCDSVITFLILVDFLCKVDCTQEMNLCRSHHIEGFPTIRVFRNGHDELGGHEHESYTGESLECVTQKVVQFSVCSGKELF